MKNNDTEPYNEHKNLTQEMYYNNFPLDNNLFDEISKREKALNSALEIRKFEIEMYWKRATYFWTIIAVIFTGYFVLINEGGLEKYPNLVFLVNCVGFIFSLSWFLVNRGSKFWQNNWERHVDLLEDEITGPLYKTVIQKKDIKFWHIHKEGKYSVSKVNQLLSLYLTAIWLFIGFRHLFWPHLSKIECLLWFTTYQTHFLAFGTLVTAILLLVLGKADPVEQDTKESVRISKRKL